jgi:FixJ family two-component response regulator
MLRLPRLVVVVDDDPDMLKGVQRLLTAYGFDTEVFTSAEAFLDRSFDREPVCLVLDIQLGGMSGVDLRRRLWALGRTVPVVFMTAFDDETTHKDALDAGCVAYLRKPFLAHALIGAIEGSAGSPRAKNIGEP